MTKESAPQEDQFSFGFEKVSAQEKSQKVKGVFENVSSRYDLMNDVMSAGLHRRWKRQFVESLPLHNGGAYLDVAGGTGDIAQSIFQRLASFGAQSEVFVSDINPAMVREGKARRPHLTWMVSNGEALPLEDNSVDVYTIAFGLRNVTHQKKALEEAYRVLRPGGTFACLEFSHVIPPLEKLYDFYSFKVIPKMGQLIAGDKEAYQYLSESIRTFHTPEALLSLMEEAGFAHCKFEPHTGGVVAIHEGCKR